MNEQTQPTDAELLAAWDSYIGDPTAKLPLTNSDKLAFARAVLAKWGTPAGAGEPVADAKTKCPNCGAPCETTVNMRGGEHGWGTSDLERTVYRYTTQPTQAQAGAVPLTDEWIRSKCKEPWIFETAKQWVRIAESAHGITVHGVADMKGGQDVDA